MICVLTLLPLTAHRSHLAIVGPHEVGLVLLLSSFLVQL